MNILIIEDEKINADRLQRILGELDESYKVITHTTSVAETVCFLESNPARM